MAFALAERLVTGDPTSAQFQCDLYVCHFQLGYLAAATGDLATADVRYRAALATAERLAMRDSGNVEYESHVVRIRA